MNNLFSVKSPKKALFNKAYVTATCQLEIQKIIFNLLPETQSDDNSNQYTVFLNQKLDQITISICSQKSHILTLLKMNLSQIEEELSTTLIDKNILTTHQLLKLKVYFK